MILNIFWIYDFMIFKSYKFINLYDSLKSIKIYQTV